MRLLLYISIFIMTSTAVIAQTGESPCSKLTLKGPVGIAYPGDEIEFSVESKDLKALENTAFE